MSLHGSARQDIMDSDDLTEIYKIEAFSTQQKTHRIKHRNLDEEARRDRKNSLLSMENFEEIQDYKDNSGQQNNVYDYKPSG